MAGSYSPYDEWWVHSPDGQSMSALINCDVGWLYYFRFDGDPSLISNNPDYDGPSEATIEYELSNGQHDFYPASWALPIATLEAAFDFFEKEHRPPPFIVWQEG